MDLSKFQQAQVDIENSVITEAIKLHPEYESQIKSHAWSLDISDMVWECCRCYAVLYDGKRRFMDCKTEGIAHMKTCKDGDLWI